MRAALEKAADGLKTRVSMRWDSMLDDMAGERKRSLRCARLCSLCVHDNGIQMRIRRPVFAAGHIIAEHAPYSVKMRSGPMRNVRRFVPQGCCLTADNSKKNLRMKNLKPRGMHARL